MVREHLRAHPPEGFEIAAIPEKIPITRNGESVLEVTYRLRRGTIEIGDALSLPRGQAVSKRIADVRGWALSSLPAGNPAREEILAGSAAARERIPFKRVVTPAGTGVSAVVTLGLVKENGAWKVSSESSGVSAPGRPDDPAIPLENSGAVGEKLGQLEALAGRLEAARKAWLAEQERLAALSLAELRERLQTGRTFEGQAGGGIPVRLVVSRGVAGDGSAVAVLTVQRGSQSAARFAGAISRQPAGGYAWRADRVATLSGNEPSLASGLRPVLTLTPAPAGLVAQIKTASHPAATIPLREADKVDLIPDSGD